MPLIALAIVLILSFLGYHIAQQSLQEYNNSRVIVSSDITKQQVNIETPVTKKEVEEIIGDYLVKNPEIIVSALESLNEMRIKEQNEKITLKIKAKQTQLQDITIAPYIGNEKGDVKIVAFLDYNCGYCKKANEALDEFVASDPNVLVIYQLHPILGEGSQYFAQVSLAVNKIAPDKFKLVHNKLMKERIETKDDMAKILHDCGVAIAAVEKELEQGEVRAQLDRSTSLGKYIGITGVPATIVNDKFFTGFLDAASLKNIASQLRSNAR